MNAEAQKHIKAAYDEMLASSKYQHLEPRDKQILASWLLRHAQGEIKTIKTKPVNKDN